MMKTNNCILNFQCQMKDIRKCIFYTENLDKITCLHLDGVNCQCEEAQLDAIQQLEEIIIQNQYLND